MADIVRSIDPKTFQIPKDAVDAGKRMRRAYVDAIRDWVAKGESSEFVLPTEEARRRAPEPDDTDGRSRRRTLDWASIFSSKAIATRR